MLLLAVHRLEQLHPHLNSQNGNLLGNGVV